MDRKDGTTITEQILGIKMNWLYSIHMANCRNTIANIFLKLAFLFFFLCDTQIGTVNANAQFFRLSPITTTPQLGFETQPHFDSTAKTALAVLNPIIYQAQPTASTYTYQAIFPAVMAGLKGSFTPTISGKVFVMMNFNASQSVAADGFTISLTRGTGTAPNVNSAFTGTSFGASKDCANFNSANKKYPFEISAITTGLTLNTPYWFDLSIACMTGGITTLTNISISIFEL